jgi:nucleoside 2-deoxyribosyltransferase
MNIYFSCSITGGRNDQGIYKLLVDQLTDWGHEVPTAILASPNVLDYESSSAPNAVYKRDVKWVEDCDALIAEVSTPSHGVGYEIALALMLKKPVLCCYQKGRKVSKMITGNDMPNLQLSTYETENQLLNKVEEFLAGLKPA